MSSMLGARWSGVGGEGSLSIFLERGRHPEACTHPMGVELSLRGADTTNHLVHVVGVGGGLPPGPAPMLSSWGSAALPAVGTQWSQHGFCQHAMSGHDSKGSTGLLCKSIPSPCSLEPLQLWMRNWGHSDFKIHFSLSCIGEGNGNPLQCSCLENPRAHGDSECHTSPE